MTFIIGLAGPGGVGKSTTAKALSKMLNGMGIHSTNYAFAEPLYEICSLITGIPIETLKAQNFKEKFWTDQDAPIPCLNGWTPRKLLQMVGTECFRNNIHQNFWIELAISKVKEYDIAVFEDARFTNEYEKCHIVYEVTRDGVDYLQNHASAMPPDKRYISAIINLTKNVDFSPFVENALHCRKYGYGLECIQKKSDSLQYLQRSNTGQQ
jgi:DNA polymerase III delta prime subunit